MIITTDLSKFGMREIKELKDILTAWVNNGLPHDFNHDGVHPMFNMNSGNVFLTNEDYQVAMMSGGELESFYSCPECGHEGFFYEMANEGQECCLTYVKECRGL
jgi:hypothetical protein